MGLFVYFCIMLYADVILPLPLADSYTYSVPPQWENAVKRGCRVVVQLGVKKMYTGVVLEVHDRKPDVATVKPMLELLDEQPVVSDSQLKFWRWVAEYYNFIYLFHAMFFIFLTRMTSP